MKRNDWILTKKFIQYMIPAFGTAIAVSLNEFVDSIMVSQLLGSDAMAIVDLGTPVMLLAACIYALFGIGGSIVYSRFIGEKKEGEAGGVFRLSLILTLVIGAAAGIVSLLFLNPIAEVLSRGSGMLDVFLPYLRILFLSFPLVVGVMTIATFLPAMNRPVLGSTCAILSNGVNLLMDYVFIRWFHMDVNGAALATITGYAVTGVMLVVLFLRKKIPLPSMKGLKLRLRERIPEILGAGTSDALTQLGFAVTWGFCNSIAAGYGNDALVAFSFFMQLGSIISIFLAGICDGALPIYALLYGSKDSHGIRLLSRKVVVILTACSLSVVGLFLFFPQMLYSMFAIETEAQQQLCLRSIQAFAIYAPVRSLLVLYRIILNSGKHVTYASFLSVIDSIVGVFIFTLLATMLWGVDGLWYAYTLNTAALVLIIAVVNHFLWRNHRDEITGVLLLPRNQSEFLLDVTITSVPEQISQISQETVLNCRKRGFDERTSFFAGLLVEEMAVYTHNRCGVSQYIDILMHQEGDDIQVDFRSIGKPFNPMVADERDTTYNVELLNRLSSSIRYAYAIGLNTTTLTIKAERKCANV